MTRETQKKYLPFQRSPLADETPFDREAKLVECKTELTAWIEQQWEQRGDNLPLLGGYVIERGGRLTVILRNLEERIGKCLFKDMTPSIRLCLTREEAGNLEALLFAYAKQQGWEWQKGIGSDELEWRMEQLNSRKLQDLCERIVSVRFETEREGKDAAETTTEA